MSTLRDNLESIEKQGSLISMGDFIDFYSTAKTEILICRVEKSRKNRDRIKTFRIPGKTDDFIVCSISAR